MFKGILMNTESVKAILAEHKTVTRRVIKPQPPFDNDSIYLRYVKDGIARFGQGTPGNSCALCDRKLPYQPGDVLYVRETFYKDSKRYIYKADYFDKEVFFQNGQEVSIKWRPSIHMPKEAARIFLRVTGVRVERLKDITVEQCIKEGFEGVSCDCAWGCTDCQGSGWLEPPIVGFVDTWNSTIKKSDLDKYGWDANPWVWAISFERISREEALKNA